MSEQNTIPTEMLDAAAKAVCAATGRSADFDHTAEARDIAEAALRAAGVPELVVRIASAEQIIASRQSELNIARARIAELEAALALAIPRMEHLQSLLSCGESVQFCNEFDEQKGKDVAKEIERLKWIMQNAPTGAGGE